ncbi:MAG: hypothetical protein JXA60_02005 [Candidatus Coatesbacteria bacterium]|nr:hypothetical protein [Candidatus Coatesbacteria bacterium]
MNRLILLIILVSCFGSIHAVDDLESYKKLPDRIKENLEEDQIKYKMKTFSFIKKRLFRELGYKQEYKESKDEEGGYVFNEYSVANAVAGTRIVCTGTIVENEIKFLLGRRSIYKDKMTKEEIGLELDNDAERRRVVIKINKILLGKSALTESNMLSNIIIRSTPYSIESSLKKGDEVIIYTLYDKHNLSR